MSLLEIVTLTLLLTEDWVECALPGVVLRRATDQLVDSLLRIPVKAFTDWLLILFEVLQLRDLVTL